MSNAGGQPWTALERPLVTAQERRGKNRRWLWTTVQGMLTAAAALLTALATVAGVVLALRGHGQATTAAERGTNSSSVATSGADVSTGSSASSTTGPANTQRPPNTRGGAGLPTTTSGSTPPRPTTTSSGFPATTGPRPSSSTTSLPVPAFVRLTGDCPATTEFGNRLTAQFDGATVSAGTPVGLRRFDSTARIESIEYGCLLDKVKVTTRSIDVWTGLESMEAAQRWACALAARETQNASRSSSPNYQYRVLLLGSDGRFGDAPPMCTSPP